MVLVLFTTLALIGERFLGVLSTKHVSMERVKRLIFPRVFVLLFDWPVSLKILGINLLGA